MPLKIFKLCAEISFCPRKHFTAPKKFFYCPENFLLGPRIYFRLCADFLFLTILGLPECRNYVNDCGFGTVSNIWQNIIMPTITLQLEPSHICVIDTCRGEQ